MNKIERAVVTGASGFIGRLLVKKLVELNIEVITVGKSPFLEKGLSNSIICDITEKRVLEKYLDNKTTIFHLAAIVSVKDSVIHPRNDIKVNLSGFLEVLESARRCNTQLLFPSTASIFDPNNPLPLSEKSYIRPSSPYGAAKAAGEAYCSAYHRCYNMDIRVARLFSVYGEGMYQFAIHDIVKKIQNNHKKITILGNGSQVRDYLYISDAVQGMIDIVTKGEPGEDYNLCSGVPTRIIDLTRKIAKTMGYPNLKIIPTGLPIPGEVPKFYGDISKIKKIGFSPMVSLDRGLKKTICWLTEDKSQ